MTAISPVTRIKIKAYLEVFIEDLIKEYKDRKIPVLGNAAEYLNKRSYRGQLKPFHAAIIPTEILRINEFERGFSSSLGSTFEECARLIALEHHREVYRSFDVTGEVSTTAINEIEHQISLFEHAAENKGQKPSFEKMVNDVLSSREGGNLENRVARADLFIHSKDGTFYFFEIKSPMPNKGQCLEVTQRLLRFHLLKGQPRPVVNAYYAMAYNPYGPNREQYKWNFALNYLPFDQALVVGQEFWNIIGGPTAYKELLEIYQEVGREKSKYMLDALAFGFW
ncbi:MAG: TdeIII family type II restriction endonuclease [Firmicutes bacterium]|nr:TdeIII family type II restriction endonuclease [Bacillota bacterium]